MTTGKVFLRFGNRKNFLFYGESNFLSDKRMQMKTRPPGWIRNRVDGLLKTSDCFS